MAVLDQSAIVGVFLDESDQRLYRRYFGRNPNTSWYGLICTLFFPMSAFLAGLADVAVPTVRVGGPTPVRAVESVADVRFAPGGAWRV